MKSTANFVSPLATVDQKRVEQLALHILASPEVRAAREPARALMAAHPVALTPDGRARLDHALDAWIANLALQEISSDVSIPSIPWVTNLACYRWFGHEFPGSATAVDNPDNVYRCAGLNSSSAYEIRGQLHPQHPAQFSFHLTNHPGADGFDATENGNDVGGYQMLTDDNLEIASDGSFRITLSPEPADGRSNHIQMRAGRRLYIIVRDTLSDWQQTPNALTLHHTGGEALPAQMTLQQLTAQTAADLSHYVGFWLRFIDSFHQNPPHNTLVAPYARNGGWGYANAGRFDLKDDQAIVITILDGLARYASIQITDAWVHCPSPLEYLSNYNQSQSMPNPDGTITYIIAPRDPGYVNWLDTGGCHQGWMQFRWQGLPAGFSDGHRLVRELKVVGVADLAAVLPASVHKVTATQRRAELRTRVEEWRLRVAEGE